MGVKNRELFFRWGTSSDYGRTLANRFFRGESGSSRHYHGFGSIVQALGNQANWVKDSGKIVLPSETGRRLSETVYARACKQALLKAGLVIDPNRAILEGDLESCSLGEFNDVKIEKAI